MRLTGFFDIHSGEPQAESAPAAGTTDGVGFSVRIGWLRDTPYLIDLGSAGRVLVNGIPIEPHHPVIIQAGDQIAIGPTHLTWTAPVETGQHQAEPATFPQAEVPVRDHDLIPADAADSVMVLPREVGEQVRARTRDPASVQSDQVGPATASATREPTDPSPADRVDLAYKTVWIDMADILDEDTPLEFHSTTILRDTQTPHLVVHTPDRTWEVHFSAEAMTIGQDEDNDITLLDDAVSRRHARIERQGDSFVILDTESLNGLWLGGQRVEEHHLRDGDVLSLGHANLVFKGGFTSNDLTLIGTPFIDGRPARRPVVFVPGLMGSELWIGSERLWPDIRTIITKPEVFGLPGDPRIEARGIVNDVVVVPHLIEQRQYSALGDYLVSGLGYTRGKDLLEFGYDWRQDVRLSAQRLAETVDRWHVEAPITIIAHSLGTLVTRYYVERMGGKRCVERIILLGGPHYGTPQSLPAILHGPGLLPFGIANERLRKVLATLPTAYQILPIYPCVFDQYDNRIDILRDQSWLPEAQRPFLSDARSFRRELGSKSSVPAVSIFGYGLKTKLRLTIDRNADGLWQKLVFEEDTAGDQSVPAGSAVLKDSEIHPVLQEHGSLYVDEDVRMRLKVELTRSTTWRKYA